MPDVAPPRSSTLTLARQRGMLSGWFAPLFFLLLSTLFLWRSTFTGEVFLPANLLGHVAPWTSAIKPDQLPPWNPLRWDGIAQFYPWRHFAGDILRSGLVPLWDPYQFCGTPFVANSQSAVFYPGNLLFYVLPTARAFGASALLHLTLCGWFTYLLLRRLGCREPSALLGGVAYAFSAWQINWLQLPAFLATSCWFPLLLRQIYGIGTRYNGQATRHKIQGTRYEAQDTQAGEEEGSAFTASACALYLVSLSLTIGMMLLAGHLQIAFYGLLAGCLWAIALLVVRTRRYGTGYGARFLGVCVAGLVLGGMLALPQILPALELSRVSHRQGKPSAGGYALYVEYGLPSAGLVMLALPEFFGSDMDTANPYYGFYTKHSLDGSAGAVRHNAAETAVYVGILPLLLALLIVIRQFKRRTVDDSKRVFDRRVLFFAGLAALALLLALGTPLNALFYFLVPGFSQSGSPARCLVLWALAVSVLAAFGLDSLLRQPPTKREIGLVLGAFGFVFAIGLSLASQALRADIGNLNELKVPAFGEAITRIGAGWVRVLLLSLAGFALLVFGSRRLPANPETDATNVPSAAPFPRSALLALGLVIADLFVTGMGINPTAPPEAVYPVTPGIKYVQEHVGHERIVPINKRWSLSNPPPAVLPPNAAMVYGLRDAQGYDSLLTGQYKQFANTLARPNPDGSMDASPPEVGNMVFIQNPVAPGIADLGAMFALTLPTTAPNFDKVSASPPENAVYNQDNEMAVFPLPASPARAHLENADGSPLNAPAAVTYREDGVNRVVLDVNAPAPAMLTLADQWYPGWQAQVDDRPAPLLHSGYEGVFRAVSVPAGTHAVAFRYEPASYRFGLYLALLSCGTLMFCAALSIALNKQNGMQNIS
jgi:hypothetical protein